MNDNTNLPSKLNSMSKGTKAAAIEFYNLWKCAGALNPNLGSIIVNRTGWAHITRPRRPVPRMFASFELLPAAARIVSEIEAWQVLRRGERARSFDDGSWGIYDYLGLPALVKWPARAPSEVMVILRRLTRFKGIADGENTEQLISVVDRKTWFYSVYEPSRGKRDRN